LMWRYLELLSRSVIRGYQWALPLDIALLGVQDLAKVGPIDLVIVGWPCQGHIRAGRGEGLRDLQSHMFWEMLRDTFLNPLVDSTEPKYGNNGKVKGLGHTP
jgi:hypothetical protein